MKIGVVCEGKTDYIAISHYVGSALRKSKIEPVFVALQPPPDNSSGGGWANVITWLENHPIQQRSVFFQQGLFAHTQRASQLDLIILQLDTDILGDEGALNFLRQRNIEPPENLDLEGKAVQIDTILRHFSNIPTSQALHARHICAPISESSEAWCIAADPLFEGNPEALSGQDLCNAFGAALARSVNKAVQPRYARINKKEKSRDRYCRSTAEKIELLERCTLFKRLVDNLQSYSKSGV